MSKDIRAALVIETNDSYDENSLSVIDLKSLQVISDNVLLIQTKSFTPPITLVNGAGEVLTNQQLKDLFHKLVTSTT